MIPDDLIITKRSSKRPIHKVTTEALIQNDTFLTIDIATLKALLQWPYFDFPTYNGPIYNCLIYKSQAKCFSL